MRKQENEIPEENSNTDSESVNLNTEVNKDEIDELTEEFWMFAEKNKPFLDCYDGYLKLKPKHSFEPGVYKIFQNPDGLLLSPNLYTSAYCLEDGWTVIQSRGQFGNPADYFNKTWAEYKAGFGTPGMN